MVAVVDAIGAEMTGGVVDVGAALGPMPGVATAETEVAVGDGIYRVGRLGMP